MKRQIKTVWLVLLCTCLCGFSKGRDKDKTPVRENIEWLDVWMPRTNDTLLPRVLLIGNSITRAYNNGVEKRLEGKAYVARLATSKSIGDPALLQEIALILSYYDFDVVHFNNGMHGWGYTEAEYAEAFPDFYRTIRRGAPRAKLIWATTTPVRMGSEMQEFAPTTERVRERNRIAAAYLADKAVVINDLFGCVAEHPEYYAGGDGVHPVASGVEALADQVVETILSVLPETDMPESRK